MSLIKENDIIIPGTVGIITSAVKEANRHLDRFREHSTQEEKQDKNVAEYMREMSQIHFILQNRVNGVPLDQLVEPSRISNDKTRSITKEEDIREQESEQRDNKRVYEDWFRG